MPAENLIGEEGKGWTYAKFLLAHERFGIAGVGASKRQLERLKEISKDLGDDDLTAKVSQLASLPQGQPERDKRVVAMVDKMDEEGFGHCTNTGACEAECPKEISQEYIRKMNWEYHRANIKG